MYSEKGKKIKARLSNAQSREIHLLFSLTFSNDRLPRFSRFFIETTMAFNHGDETEPFEKYQRVKEIFGKIYTNYTQISLLTWKGIESKWKFLERSFAVTFVVVIVILQKKKKDNARISKYPSLCYFFRVSTSRCTRVMKEMKIFICKRVIKRELIAKITTLLNPFKILCKQVTTLLYLLFILSPVFNWQK